jgi:hypothetical protein
VGGPTERVVLARWLLLTTSCPVSFDKKTTGKHQSFASPLANDYSRLSAFSVIHRKTAFTSWQTGLVT